VEMPSEELKKKKVVPMPEEKKFSTLHTTIT
jgi:hypothetical protein